MEPDQCSWEKPLKRFLKEVLIAFAEKLNVIHKAAILGMILMVFYNFFGKEIRHCYRRYVVIREDFLAFGRAYRHALLDRVDSLESEDEEEVVATPPTNRSEKVAAVDNQSEWDFGSSDEDAYETDLDDETKSDLAKAIAEHECKLAELARQREQVRIAETIEFDEYLLEKGLIDESEFGKTLMVEI